MVLRSPIFKFTHTVAHNSNTACVYTQTPLSWWCCTCTCVPALELLRSDYVCCDVSNLKFSILCPFLDFGSFFAPHLYPPPPPPPPPPSPPPPPPLLPPPPPLPLLHPSILPLPLVYAASSPHTPTQSLVSLSQGLLPVSDHQLRQQVSR